MKKTENALGLINQLEYEINEHYGSEFLEDIQGMCGVSNGHFTNNNMTKYLFMLRGVWYATHQEKKPIKKKKNKRVVEEDLPF